MCTQLRLRALGIAALLAMLVPACLSAQEVEPNGPCELAQSESALTLPLTITGSLDSTESFADVDFYHFTGTPFDDVQVILEGFHTDAGTLVDPFFGWFNSDCEFQLLGDFTGLQAQTTLKVPQNGEYIIGVSQCCDYQFEGGGEGSYSLTLDSPPTAKSIFGTIEDAETHAPLPGGGPPFVYLSLSRCDDYLDCNFFVANGYPDGSGAFSFTEDYQGLPLPVGVYRLLAFAQGYEDFAIATFEVAEDQEVDLGALQMTPIPVIGVVTGRVIDAMDGTPLGSAGYQYVQVLLELCVEDQCSYITIVTTDEMGRFRFVGSEYLAPAGEYVVTVQTDGYWPGSSARFEIGRNEDVDVGDIGIRPIPVRFGEPYICEIEEGQDCEFGIEIGVRVAKQLAVEAWSLVQFWPTANPEMSSVFQVGNQGASNPKSQKLNLKPGQDQTLQFKVSIPDQLPDYFSVCASFFIGASPDPQWDLIAQQSAFCAFKQDGVLRLMSDEESRKFLREKKLR